MIARIYNAAANLDGRYVDGVPLADIDQETWDALPGWLRRSVDASGLYSAPSPDAPPEGGVLSVDEPVIPRRTRGAS